MITRVVKLHLTPQQAADLDVIVATGYFGASLAALCEGLLAQFLAELARRRYAVEQKRTGGFRHRARPAAGGCVMVIGQLAECRWCNRVMLIERGMIGVNHTATLDVVCWDCLKPEAQAEAVARYRLTPPEEKP